MRLSAVPPEDWLLRPRLAGLSAVESDALAGTAACVEICDAALLGPAWGDCAATIKWQSHKAIGDDRHQWSKGIPVLLVGKGPEVLSSTAKAASSCKRESSAEGLCMAGFLLTERAAPDKQNQH